VFRSVLFTALSSSAIFLLTHPVAGLVSVTSVTSVKHGKCGAATAQFLSRALSNITANNSNLRLCNCTPTNLAALKVHYRSYRDADLLLINLAKPMRFDVPLYPAERYDEAAQSIAIAERWGADPTQSLSYVYLDVMNRKTHTVQYVGWLLRGDFAHLREMACPIGAEPRKTPRGS